MKIFVFFYKACPSLACVIFVKSATKVWQYGVMYIQIQLILIGLLYKWANLLISLIRYYSFFDLMNQLTYIPW